MDFSSPLATPKTGMKGICHGWWIVLASFLLGFYVSGTVYFGFTAFFEPLVKEFGWSYTQISLAKSLRGIEMSVFGPMIGFLVDRVGSRKMVLYGVVTTGLGLLLLSFTQSLVMFYASFLLLSFGAGGCTGVVLMTTVAKWFDKNLGRAMGIVTCGFGAGGVMLPLIVWLIDFYDWRTALIILALGMWGLGIPLAYVFRERPKTVTPPSDGGGLPDPMSPGHQGKDVDVSFQEALKHKTFFYLMIIEVIRHTIVSAVILHVMPYLTSMAIPRSTAGMVAAALPIFSILGRFGFGWLGDFFDKRYTMAVALCLMGLGLVAFCYVQRAWAIFIFLLLFPSGCWGVMILTRMTQRECFGRSSFGKVLGVLMGLGSIGGIIGPTLAGWVFDTRGSYSLVWFGFSGLTMITLLLVLKIKPQTDS